MIVLVTGASGYIGGQTCKELMYNGHIVLAVDRNIPRHKYFTEFFQADYFNVSDAFENKIDAVIHIAATSLVGPSVTDPKEYYSNNVAGTMHLMNACVKHGIKNFVFASSAACYGEPEGGVCSIADGNTPMNPYGWSKRMTEVMLNSYATAYGLNSVSLRFFNVAGADSDCYMGQEKQATHLIARAMESALSGKEFTLYGNDFDTPDGTCIRDYVHVEDIATGVTASLKLLDTNTGAYVFNLGSGAGSSNLEIINAINNNTPLTVNYTVGDRRDGDPAKLVADLTDTVKLDWSAKHTLDTIVKTAYNWYIR